jgi:hypothetical protein
VGRNEKKKRETFPAPILEMGVQTQNGGPCLLVVYWRIGGTLVVKDTGCEWLRLLLKQKRGILVLPKHRDNRYALELSFSR